MEPELPLGGNARIASAVSAGHGAVLKHDNDCEMLRAMKTNHDLNSSAPAKPGVQGASETRSQRLGAPLYSHHMALGKVLPNTRPSPQGGTREGRNPATLQAPHRMPAMLEKASPREKRQGLCSYLSKRTQTRTSLRTACRARRGMWNTN